MKKKKIPVIMMCSLIAIIVVGLTMITFTQYVQSSLWEKSVNDILDSTTQEQKAFQLYIEKDIENLSSILKGVSLEDDNIKEAMMHHSNKDGINFIYVNLDNRTYVNNRSQEKLLDEEVKRMKSFQSNQGVTKPYYNRDTGVKMIAAYIKMGNELLIKETQVDYIANEFSLSFYNDLGFSYIVDDAGEILVRTDHKNANRTMQNLFDIVDFNGNDEETIQSFENALSKHQKGYALFNYQDDTNVFCYVPLITNGWYIVSIIPNHVIMAQANSIIMFTIILSFIIIAAIGCVLLLYQYSNRKHKNEVIRLAYYDELTGLYNYQKFKDEGEERLKDKNCQWAVIYSDMTGFKIINDLQGYEFGDKVLKELAKIIEDVILENGLTCHLTSDKFLMMCEYQNKTDLKDMVELISHELYTFLKTYDLEKDSVIKFGICCEEDDDEIRNIDGMIDRSHLALREVQINHKDSYCFYNYAMRERMMKEADIESKMDKALENREFVFYLQPKYDVNGGHILGAEALVRWITKDGQVVMPGDFIPIFEKNGFILKLDEYVFESVCQYLADRIQKHLPVVSVSINISRLHFYQPDFIERYTKIKEKYQLPEGLLELEITENILLEDMKKVQNIITKLQSQGFICSVDDFGSGYSSLNSLKDLPFDIIKLDKLFLDNSYNTKRSEEIIKSIIDMAKHIDMKTVAEGVETNEQLNFLKTTDCDMIQGYIFSKPIPVREFEKQLQESQSILS